ncbi:MAG: PmoA family protein [Verrucomicrobiales bacterium]|nr:PmoA family protein [Verrucomicrobiales bacterium]
MKASAPTVPMNLWCGRPACTSPDSRSLSRARGNRTFPLLALGLGSLLLAQAGDAPTEPTGVLTDTEAPVARRVRLDDKQLEAAREGRLGWQFKRNGAPAGSIVPVQWEAETNSAEGTVVCLMPAHAVDVAPPDWRRMESAFPSWVRAVLDAASGQVDFFEQDRPVLRYNYRTVEPGEVLSQVAEGNRRYARPRSNYLHPLYGPDGAILTRDWSLDHPHHRGIYWAWPEVDFGQERGDLHALQRVFARPTGRVHLESGPVFAQVKAENLWLWEDREPIVREEAILRAYRATPRGRVVDLVFRFHALADGVTIARRETSHYGGLNLRLATPQEQRITVHTDAPASAPRRAWSDLSGVFAGTESSGLTVLQHRDNPEYPGDWVQYPELSWVQPTFPTAGTRYPLSRERPLVLRFRLWVHPGGAIDPAWAAQLWDAWHAPSSALILPHE